MRCKLRPTMHFKMRQIERGFSDEEILRSIYEGKRETDEEGKTHGRFGPCRVIFKERPCNIILITVTT